MCHTIRRKDGWTRRRICIVMGGVLLLGGFLAAQAALWPPAVWPAPAQAAERHKRPSPKTGPLELAPFMIRNAYHLATLYHAAQAARWELAAYQAEELEENMTQAARDAGPYAQSLTDYRQEYITPLQKAIAAQDTAQFRNRFQSAVDGCNDCHKATKRAFITIPSEPPPLSIFVFPPIGR